jgi:hypothetical protein
VTGKHENEPPSGAVMSLLSRTGPEVPPDLADALPGAERDGRPSAQRDSRPGTEPGAQPGGEPGAQPGGEPGAQSRRCLEEPTVTLPVIAAATVPRRKPPARAVAARAVIVYEQVPSRPWRLWVFTAVLVALTVGVVLGQAVAYEPAGRPAADARAAVVPAPDGPAAPQQVTSPQQVTAPQQVTSPQRVSLPRGPERARLLEVTGASAVLRIRSAYLGDVLLGAAPVDAGAAPTLTDTARGPRVDLARTGAAGTVGADIELNAAVSWTIRLTGGSADADIDMRAGGLAGVDLGGAGRAVLHLPQPRGTTRLSVGGAVSDLTVHAWPGTPLRLRLGVGARLARVDGTTHRTVQPGTAFTPRGWKSAPARYDVATSGTIGSLTADHG